MIKEFILFIAYKACSGKNIVFGKNPFQYNNAIRLISVVLFIHLSQIALLLMGSSIINIGKPIYLIALGTFLFLPYLVEVIFSKNVLAKSVSKYKEAAISKSAKLIAYTYLAINILVLLLIIYLVVY